MRYTPMCLASLLLLLLAGCNNKFGFEEPQPSGVKNETVFPEKFLGRYIAKDKTIFEVLPGMIIQHQNRRDTFPLGEMAARKYTLMENKISGSDLFSGNQQGTVTIRNGKVYALWHLTDTVFRFSNEMILRQDKDICFLNLRGEDNGNVKWMVLTLQKKGRKIIVGMVDINKDIPLLKNVTRVTEMINDKDTSYTSKPSKTALLDFIKLGGFSHKEILKPTNKKH